ncbi:rhodanese-like domain-containing protein [Bacillus sinesaloumensis]|uniref:rhodanese-like domain-containing protein n=1 Tax=Litchfieldia sinesaloumensis TaxID=1926280 RepID=UPI00098836B0|nr:rhodanese-like domain-containing protein [Bacillus sinesaloumensis]
MDYINYIIFALIVIFIVQRLIPVKGIRNMTTAELKNELKDKNKQFIDVRTPGEFKGYHINGFKNMPLHQLSQKANQLSKDKEVVVICQSGMRSQKASKQLKKLGFKQITNVKGGVSSWR